MRLTTIKPDLGNASVGKYELENIIPPSNEDVQKAKNILGI